MVTGHGPGGLLPSAPERPLFREQDATALGVRNSAIARENGLPDPRRLAPGLRIFESATLLAEGPRHTGQRAAAELAARPGGFWLHLDLDVIDGEAMPAVDDPLPGGPDWEQAKELLRPLLLSPALLGADITLLNRRSTLATTTQGWWSTYSPAPRGRPPMSRGEQKSRDVSGQGNVAACRHVSRPADDKPTAIRHGALGLTRFAVGRLPRADTWCRDASPPAPRLHDP